ncbi:MAG TPA: helix-turn-helix transcriptional regulator [Vicinamibacterales bacterium]|jgi:DNA-binding PadR family transcriptional regulator
MPRSDALGEFEQSVLLAIAHLGDDAYGVSVRREIERRTQRSIAVGALYTALDRLERKGYVSSRMSEPTPERGGRSKRHFRLRAAGAAALRQARERINRMWDGLPENLKSR